VRVGKVLERPAGQLRLPPDGPAAPQAGPARHGPAAADTGAAGPRAAGTGAAGTGAGAASTGPEPALHELLLASVPVPVLRSSRERLLGPLRDYDARHKAELLPTLTSFLDCDGSWSACASRMYVHVNTVRYRISRIEALTGRDMSALADRVDFFLALRGA
jgi:DNA-binding PucR family transcriptional regulator